MSPRSQTRSRQRFERGVHSFNAAHSQGLPGPRIIDRSVQRWATVRFILGCLQMFGAAISLGLFLVNGITPLVLGAVVVTGIITTISILFFQVWKRGANLSRAEEKMICDRVQTHDSSEEFR